MILPSVTVSCVVANTAASNARTSTVVANLHKLLESPHHYDFGLGHYLSGCPLFFFIHMMRC